MQQPVWCNRCGQQNRPGQGQCWHCGTPLAYYCPYCRSTVYAGYAYCTGCGSPLYWGQWQPPANTARCPNCGSPLYFGAPSCPRCGIRLDWGQWTTDATYCPGCYAVVYPDHKSCPRCGTPLDRRRYWEKAKGAEKAKTTAAEESKGAATVPEDRRRATSVGSIISWLIALPLALFVFLLGFVYLSPQYDMYMVTSESMVPAIKMGDLIITGPVKGNIKPGTVVTYKLGETLVTHRVVSIKDNKLVTKGDAVEDPDPSPVALSQVKGVYLLKIPSLGYLADFMRTKFGWFVTVIVPAILLLGLIFWEIAKEVLKQPRGAFLYRDVHSKEVRS